MPEQAQQVKKLDFNELPERVKGWLSSLQATYLIMEINQRLGLKEERITIIPRSIYQLVTKEIDPLDFINELSNKLGINFQTAKTISEEITEKILRPIEGELRKYAEIDTKSIRFGKPGKKTGGIAVPEAPAPLPTMPIAEEEPILEVTPPIPPPIPPAPLKREGYKAPLVKPAEAEEAPKPIEEIPILPKAPMVDLESFETSRDTSSKNPPLPSPLASIAEKLPPQSKPAPVPEAIRTNGDKLIGAGGAELPKTASPFLLHEEKSIFAAPSKEQLSRRAASLNIKVKNYSQSEEEQKKPKGIPVRMEAPGQTTGQKNRKTEKQTAAPALPKEEIKSEARVEDAKIKKGAERKMADERPEYLRIKKQAPHKTSKQINVKRDGPDAQNSTVRIVHYNENRTPINNIGIPKQEGDDDNIVDLRKITHNKPPTINNNE